MAKNNFLLYKDFESTLDLLNDEQSGKLFKALYRYVNGRNEPDFENDGMLKVAFNILKTQLERDLLKYNERVKRNKENGKKGGRPSNKGKETHTDNTKPKKPTGLNENPTKAKKADSDSVSERDSDSDSLNDREKKDKYNSLTLKHFDDDEVNDLFIEFLKMRKQLKAINSERAVNTLINKLKPLNRNNQIECINNSIMNSWKGLFPKKDKEQDKDLDKERDIEGNVTNNVTNNVTPKKPKRFIKPTVEDINNYCKEKEISIDAESFIDFYESKGWKVGSSSMKDWKATVRNWARRNAKDTTQSESAKSKEIKKNLFGGRTF